MSGRRALVIAVGLALAPACGKSGPTHVGADGSVGKLEFDDPAQRLSFDDPTRQEPTGFGYGEWVVEGGVLKQTHPAADNLANHLRYVGDAFGARGGEAPGKYRVAVDIAAYQETSSPQVHGSPTGILAFMPYYRDPTHYVLLVASRHNIEVWNVDGYRAAGEVWPAEARLFNEWLPQEIKVGDTVRWQAEVDIPNKSLRVWYGDTAKEKAVLTIPGLDGAPHHVAFAANGNFVAFDNLALYYLEPRKALGFLGL